MTGREAAVKTDAAADRSWIVPALRSLSEDVGGPAAEWIESLLADREAATNTRAGLREALAETLYDHDAGEPTDVDVEWADAPAQIKSAYLDLAGRICAYRKLTPLLPVQSAVDAARARAEGVEAAARRADKHADDCDQRRGRALDAANPQQARTWAEHRNAAYTLAKRIRVLTPDAPVFLTQEDCDANLKAFASAILHGDPVHREWLIEAAQCWTEGEALPEPRSAKPTFTQEDCDARVEAAREEEREGCIRTISDLWQDVDGPLGGGRDYETVAACCDAIRSRSAQRAGEGGGS